MSTTPNPSRRQCQLGTNFALYLMPRYLKQIWLVLWCWAHRCHLLLRLHWEMHHCWLMWQNRVCPKQLLLCQRLRQHRSQLKQLLLIHLWWLLLQTKFISGGCFFKTKFISGGCCFKIKFIPSSFSFPYFIINHTLSNQFIIFVS